MKRPGFASLRPFGCIALLCALAACGSSHTTRHASVPHYRPTRYYPPPGPTSDPWGPYIREASGRFGVPEQWIRSVMRQESGGQEDVISWAGAMGLMQVMPETYAELRGRYSLGDDPFDPRNNILAGTAYLREMYDRYGAPGFLAAYNAGPNRVDRYLNNGTPLPAETVSYVAAIAPRLGPGTPMSGPLAAYGGARTQYAVARTPSGCDPDAAYDPTRPCSPPRSSPIQPAVAYAPPPAPYVPAPYVPAPTPAGCDPDAAYDPAQPCKPVPQTVVASVAPTPPVSSVSLPPPAPPSSFTPNYGASAPSGSFIAPRGTEVAMAPPPPAWSRPSPAASHALPPCDPDAAYNPARRCRYGQTASLTPATAPPPYRPMPMASRPMQEAAGPSLTAAMPAGRWGIQVGAFPSLSAAHAAADQARATLPDLLRTANVELPPTTPLGNKVAFRARLTGLPAATAIDACARLGDKGMTCMTVPPGGGV